MTTLLVALGMTVLLVVLLAAVRVATRLDRLHIRTDAAWMALDGALERRALVVRALAAAGQLPGDGEVLRVAAHRSLVTGSPQVDREALENELGRLLAKLDRSVLEPVFAAELADAEQRVVIARRVYNDAVRDTRALRSQRGVRWLRLAGSAPRPRFFEIVEPSE